MTELPLEPCANFASKAGTGRTLRCAGLSSGRLQAVKQRGKAGGSVCQTLVAMQALSVLKLLG